MRDEELPVDGGVFRCLSIQDGDANDIVVAVIFSSVDEENGKTSLCETRGKWATTGSRAHYDIIIGVRRVLVGSQSSGAAFNLNRVDEKKRPWGK